MIDKACCSFRNFCIGLTVAAITGVSFSAMADSSGKVQLPTAGDSFLQKIIDWMQSLLDFLGGAGALFFAFISGFFAIVLWAVAPKQSAALGLVLRLCVGAIGVFNLGLLIAWLQK
ncbi:hypothetical protein [Providencia rettgeri]|uniref:hypothetical protein n=1 Tax=Providencia rettgeri TaxID=587 RepID=UPI0014191424|nr:hypothetical protein [Providencia rettgeri]NIH07052.1 hypothetical protein [Providencia rettgeri]